MRKAILPVLAILLLAGCATTIGPAAQSEVTLKCKGKAALTGTGHLGVNAGVGGTQANSFTIQGDCGDGFEYKLERERTKP